LFEYLASFFDGKTAVAAARRWIAVTGTVLVTLFGLGFAVGEISELFQRNVGMSAAGWDVVLAGAVVGAVLGICSAVLGVRAPLVHRAANRADWATGGAGPALKLTSNPRATGRTARRWLSSPECSLSGKGLSWISGPARAALPRRFLGSPQAVALPAR
jgi:hypothetical protein